MTGTADTEAREFSEIYGLDVVIIPTHKDMIREDCDDLVFLTKEAKYKALIEEIETIRSKKAPVLVGTASVESSEIVSSLLTKKGIQHQVLNAKQHAKEAEIIANAGVPGAVTIATNMAGRGTDIVLGGNPKSRTLSRFQKFISYSKSLTVADQVDLSSDELSTLSKLFKDIQFPDYIYTYAQALEYLESNSDLPVQLSEELKSNYLRLSESDKNIAVADRSTVQNLGGLHVIGTERHESRRIDNQLRGRSGRQGDPGSSRFFLSLEDKLLRIFGGDKISGLMQNMGLQESVPIPVSYTHLTLPTNREV